MNLHTLTPADGSVKKVKRIGRGQGSGHGRKSTRGSKGAGQRSGTKNKRGFEGGQMPLQRRLPKFGFKNVNRKEFQVFNLDTIQKIAEKHNITEINKAFLVKNGLAHKDDRIKILGRGAVNIALNVTLDAISAKAQEIIEKAGGKVTILVFTRDASEEAIIKAKVAKPKETLVIPKVEEKAPAKTKKVVKKADDVVTPPVTIAEQADAASIKADKIATTPIATAEQADKASDKAGDIIEKEGGPIAPSTDEAEKANDN